MTNARFFAAATSAAWLTLTAVAAEPASAPLQVAPAAEATALPAAGQMAPALRLQDQAGTWHSLDQYRGKWVVLYFYPKDNTPGCTTEACEFRDNIFAFRQAGAVILGVSVDDVDSHKAFAEEHSLPFPLLADNSKKASADYGVLYKAMGIMELARRDTFIIDPAGKIAKRYSKVSAKGHSEMVLADIRTLVAKR